MKKYFKMLNCALILIWFSVASQSIASFYPTYLGGADEKQTEVLRSTCKAGLQLIFDALREQNIAGGFFEKKTKIGRASCRERVSSPV